MEAMDREQEAIERPAVVDTLALVGAIGRLEDARRTFERLADRYERDDPGREGIGDLRELAEHYAWTAHRLKGWQPLAVYEAEHGAAV